MRTISPRTAGIAAACLCLAAPPLAAQQPVPEGLAALPPDSCRAEGEERIPMMVVGSYHMANPGLDEFNLEADPVTAPRRQREVEAVVDALADFRPTAVAVEARHADRDAWQERYEAYRAGDRELESNEREQIGFRLAARMDHDSIHAVDVRTPFSIDAVREAAEGNRRYRELMAGLDRAGRDAMETMGGWLESSTVGGMLWRMNTPAALQANHRVYFEYLLPVVAADSFPGADLVENWYGRNLRIFALLQSLAEADDRVLVLFGQGHAPTLRRFAADDPRFCVADPLPYLAEAKEAGAN
jgi:hypothetical protein